MSLTARQQKCLKIIINKDETKYESNDKIVFYFYYLFDDLSNVISVSVFEIHIYQGTK